MPDDPRWTAVDRFLTDLLVPADPALDEALRASAAAGLPPIHVSANQGKLLMLLAMATGARRILEIGTLGGYSTTWLARALPAGGSVTSLELDPAHAAVARRNVDGAGIGAAVTIEVGPAEQSLQALIERRAAPFDMIFIDADKPGYSRYLDLSLELSRPGTMIIADNLVRDGAVLDEHSQAEHAGAARDFNARLAAHPRLESIIVPVLGKKVDGMSISIVK